MRTFLKNSVVLTLFLGLLCAACQNETSREVQNMETFARLYGYARWFHPSDEAQEIDWDKFAVLGIQKVENVTSDQALRDTLYQLFSPIVQGLQIYETRNPEAFNSDVLLSPDKNAKPVAWQHSGVYLNNKSNIYQSARIHQKNFDKNTNAALVCKISKNPSDFQGKEVKLSGHFKTKNSNKESVKLFIQYFFQNDNQIQDAVIEAADWKEFGCSVKIPENVIAVAYGLWILDNCEVWADDFEFLVKKGGKWESIDKVNMGFESGEINGNQAEDWQVLNMKNCTFEVTDKDAYSGKYSLKLAFDFTGKIFDRMPQFGEIVNEPIGNNLTCVIPLVLQTNDLATYPKSETLSFIRLKSEMDSIHLSSEFNMQVNLASVVVAWNVLQHFFPYFDVIDTDWNKVLGETLKSTLENKQKEDYFITISQMFAKLDDGHGIVFDEHMFCLPIRTELIENKIVVTASNDSLLKRGDIIKKIDGKSAMAELEEKEKIISGSPQLRRHRALNIWGGKFNSGDTKLMIERDGKEQNVTVPNSSRGNMFFNPINDHKYLTETIVEIEPQIYYVNMTNSTEDDFNKKIDVLANAKAVIYDQRGGKELNFFHIIPHLIEKPVMSAWWNVPQTIYPDRKEVEFSKSNWDIQPKQPLFKSKTIIINVPSVVSSGETAMGIIDHYNLATTVGETTAGCNGNVNTIKLPYGYSAWFTGMKVLKHDGKQLYIKGFQPDYPVTKTLQAIKEGRDEYLEKALEIARGE
ncbi:S41 family peptidase [Parabacteroides pacaensis]|uniref:S41 family peptidase n=1 Tax=Parabacteroides pacaensis TaxID=2086575 RepID=UPI000D0FCB5E|nr:S41 family peptidase [Parabacteroides pacaensis]